VEHVPEELGDQLPALEEISAGVQRIVERHSEEVAEAEANEVPDADRSGGETIPLGLDEL